MMEQKIIRCFDAEMRASDNKDMTAEGYALKFNKITQIGNSRWGFKEKISSRALDGVKLDNVFFTFNHDMSSILSGTNNRSLSLTVDNVGLKVSTEIIDTALGRDVFKLIKEGLITKMSFMAIVKESQWTISENDEEMDEREITAFERFFDVSAVTFPAYEDTQISARNADLSEWRKEKYNNQMKKLNKILGGKN